MGPPVGTPCPGAEELEAKGANSAKLERPRAGTRCAPPPEAAAAEACAEGIAEGDTEKGAERDDVGGAEEGPQAGAGATGAPP